MIARIANQFPCSETELWQRIIEPRSLQFVAAPLLTFTPIEAGALEGEWQVDRDYPLQLYFMRFIPLGRHTIRLVKIDRSTNTILSEERGSLAHPANLDFCSRVLPPPAAALEGSLQDQRLGTALVAGAGWATASR